MGHPPPPMEKEKEKRKKGAGQGVQWGNKTCIQFPAPILMPTLFALQIKTGPRLRTVHLYVVAINSGASEERMQLQGQFLQVYALPAIFCAICFN